MTRASSNYNHKELAEKWADRLISSKNPESFKTYAYESSLSSFNKVEALVDRLPNLPLPPRLLAVLEVMGLSPSHMTSTWFQEGLSSSSSQSVFTSRPVLLCHVIDCLCTNEAVLSAISKVDQFIKSHDIYMRTSFDDKNPKEVAGMKQSLKKLKTVSVPLVLASIKYIVPDLDRLTSDFSERDPKPFPRESVLSWVGMIKLSGCLDDVMEHLSKKQWSQVRDSLLSENVSSLPFFVPDDLACWLESSNNQFLLADIISDRPDMSPERSSRFKM